MTTALAKPDPTMSLSTLNLMLQEAEHYVRSGLLPSSIKNAQQALIIMKMGREIGVPATYALRNINVINGKPTAAAELMLGLIQRDHGQQAICVRETNNESCTVQYRQQGWDGTMSYSFTIEDAKRAGLLANQTWTKYPAAMLRARCISAVARMAFPASIGGLYTPEEMGANVDEDGTIIDVTPNGHQRALPGQYIADRHQHENLPRGVDAPDPIEAAYRERFGGGQVGKVGQAEPPCTEDAEDMTGLSAQRTANYIAYKAQISALRQHPDNQKFTDWQRRVQECVTASLMDLDQANDIRSEKALYISENRPVGGK